MYLVKYQRFFSNEHTKDLKTAFPRYGRLRECHKITNPIRPLLRTASGVARQSATIVADNRLALAPSMAVEYGRILPSRALLAARSNTLGLESVIW
ncbi:MAG: hypothetical protein ACI8W7_001503 [Gammaproteobacteria bacterium]|jgi:hypothetical protein